MQFMNETALQVLVSPLSGEYLAAYVALLSGHDVTAADLHWGFGISDGALEEPWDLFDPERSPTNAPPHFGAAFTALDDALRVSESGRCLLLAGIPVADERDDALRRMAEDERIGLAEDTSPGSLRPEIINGAVFLNDSRMSAARNGPNSSMISSFKRGHGRPGIWVPVATLSDALVAECARFVVMTGVAADDDSIVNSIAAKVLDGIDTPVAAHAKRLLYQYRGLLRERTKAAVSEMLRTFIARLAEQKLSHLDSTSPDAWVSALRGEHALELVQALEACYPYSSLLEALTLVCANNPATPLVLALSLGTELERFIGVHAYLRKEWVLHDDPSPETDELALYRLMTVPLEHLWDDHCVPVDGVRWGYIRMRLEDKQVLESVWATGRFADLGEALAAFESGVSSAERDVIVQTVALIDAPASPADELVKRAFLALPVPAMTEIVQVCKDKGRSFELLHAARSRLLP